MKHLILAALLLTACHESIHYTEDSDSFVYDELVKGDDYGDMAHGCYGDSSTDTSVSGHPANDYVYIGEHETEEENEGTDWDTDEYNEFRDTSENGPSDDDSDGIEGSTCEIGNKTFYTVAITQNPETGIIDLDECGLLYHVGAYNEVAPGAQRYMYIDRDREPYTRCGRCHYHLIGSPVWCKLGVELDADGLPQCVDGIECKNWAMSSGNKEYYCNED